MPPKRKITCLVIGLLIVGMMASCQRTPSSPTPNEEILPSMTVSLTAAPASPTPLETVFAPSLEGAVRIWLSWNSKELYSMHRVIDRFLEQNPGSNFSIAYFPEEDLAGALEAIKEGGMGPSIVFAPSTWGARIWSQGLIVDITDRIDEELETNVHPLAWSQVTYQDARIGLPLELQGVVLYRNRSLAGAAPQNVNAWVEAARQLKEEGKVGIAFDLGFDFTVSQIAACGGSVMDEMGAVTIDNPAGYCWLELLSYIRGPSRVTFNSDEDLALFETGQAGWVIDGTWNARRYEEAVGIQNLIVDLWPLYEDTDRRLAGFVWTENMYLLQGLSDVEMEAAWAFMRYLLTPEAQGLLSQSSNADHLSVLSGLESSDILQRELTAALFMGVPRPIFEDLDLYRPVLESAVEMAAVQGSNPELAIDVALSKIELLGSDVENEE